MTPLRQAAPPQACPPSNRTDVRLWWVFAVDDERPHGRSANSSLDRDDPGCLVHQVVSSRWTHTATSFESSGKVPSAAGPFAMKRAYTRVPCFIALSGEPSSKTRKFDYE